MSARNKSNEFTLTRVLDAPVVAVWDAFNEPEQTAQWWGPRGFTITSHSKILKPGGHWHYTMHGPDGTNYENKTVYLEVDKHKRLVYDHGGNDDRPALFRVTVLFLQQGDKTRLEFTMACATPEAAEEIQKHIKKMSGNSTWDRLTEYLEKEKSQNEIFVINRTFNAPKDTLFRMWTDPQHFSQWLAPANSSLEFIESNIAIGKTTFYKMSNTSGLVIYGKMTYMKIEPPDFLEYSQFFCDQKGNLSRHPLAPSWPEKMLTRVAFAEEHDGQTRVTVTWLPQGKVTEEEMAAFVEMRAGMTQGWTQSFDKLEAYLPG